MALESYGKSGNLERPNASFLETLRRDIRARILMILFAVLQGGAVLNCDGQREKEPPYSSEIMKAIAPLEKNFREICEEDWRSIDTAVRRELEELAEERDRIIREKGGEPGKTKWECDYIYDEDGD